MAPKKIRSVPGCWRQWAAAARKLRVEKKSVHTRENFESGSKVTEEEHLRLRVLCPPKAPKAQAIKSLGLEKYFDEASDWLDTFEPFNQYLNGIENSVAPGTSDMGLFELPYSQQYQVCKFLDEQKSPAEKGLDGVNEDIANSSLISFLTAVCLKHPSINAHWTPRRATLTAAFKKAKLAGKESLKCEIDGFFLAANEGSQAQVILEAKANDRRIHEPQVTRQESYEVVAALLTDSPKTGLRAILIAQNGRELYLSNAVCSDEYMDYMTGIKKDIKKTEFLQLQRYGPWNIKHRFDMEEFAKLALAVALRASAEQRSGQNLMRS